MKLCAEFLEQDTALAAHRALIDEGVEPQKVEIRSSYPLVEEAIPPHRTRPFNMRKNVKMCWFIGGITGFLMVAATEMDWPLYTSGHQIIAIPINMIPTYESAMITGLITTTLFFFSETRPFRNLHPHPAEDLPVARGNIALLVEDTEAGLDKVKQVLKGRGARSIVTYCLLFLMGLGALTGCEVRMRDQRSIKSTDQGVASIPEAGSKEDPGYLRTNAEVQQPMGTVSMPTAEEQEVGPVPVLGYANWPDVQRLEDLNSKMIPKAVLAMKNPVPPDVNSRSRGQVIYLNQCSFCHGLTGHGEGKVGAVFKPHPPALAEAATAAMTDGAMFWKISVGPNTMPPFANRLTIKERFDVINFIRAMEKGGAKS